MSKEVKVPRRIAAVILNSLKGGVVPRIGLFATFLPKHVLKVEPWL